MTVITDKKQKGKPLPSGNLPDDVLVVGSGASGMMAAIHAARSGARVRILEKSKKPGRKLLLTGNGRCNLTHLDEKLPARYQSQRGDLPQELLAGPVFTEFGVRETLCFFEDLGLMTQDRDGYVYPRSGQSQSVLNVLLAELKRLSVRMKYDTPVTGLEYDDTSGLWMVQTEGWAYPAKSVILSCGSRAGIHADRTEADADPWRLAKKLGHSVAAPRPALTAMHCPDPDIRLCEGARTKARVSLQPAGAQGRAAGAEEGELQWTASEISGIPVFQLSRYVYGLSKRAPRKLQVDFLPEMEEGRLRQQLTALMLRYDIDVQDKEELSRMLTGFVSERIAVFLVKKSMETMAAAAKENSTKASAQVESAAAVLAAYLKRLTLPVDGVRDFPQAQICIGGVSLNEVNADTLESRLWPGLFLTGELLDIDGPCGGYNLQWAWSSGAAAGRAAGRRLLPR